MASEVPTNELNALVTCELPFFKRVLTLEPLIYGVTRSGLFNIKGRLIVVSQPIDVVLVWNPLFGVLLLKPEEYTHSFYLYSYQLDYFNLI